MRKLSNKKAWILKKRKGKTKSPSKKTSFWGRLVKTIIYFSVFLTIISVYYSFQTKIKISTKLPLNPKDPFTAPFILENESVFSIYEIEYYYYIRELKTKQNSGIQGIYTQTHRTLVSELASGQRTVIFIILEPYLYFPNIIKGDIDIHIKYKPRFAFWYEEHIERFITIMDVGKNLNWYDYKE
jgi:hypothetical protein